MRLNINTRLVGKNTILVPYREHHVPKYVLYFICPFVIAIILTS